MSLWQVLAIVVGGVLNWLDEKFIAVGFDKSSLNTRKGGLASKLTYTDYAVFEYDLIISNSLNTKTKNDVFYIFILLDYTRLHLYHISASW